MKTKFFTGEGDKGESIIGGKSISKNSALMEMLGGLDELNSWLGFTRVEAEKLSGKDELGLPAVLKKIQESLFIIQSEVAALGFGFPKKHEIKEEKTKELEEVILKIDGILPELKKFIIVGGMELSARLDYGRAIARRVERMAKKYEPAGGEKPLSPDLLRYLNRLSSALFALARYVNHISGIKEEHPSYG